MSSGEKPQYFRELKRKIAENPLTPRIIVAAASFLLILVITGNHFAHPTRPKLEAGVVATEDYRAPFDVVYEDTLATEKAREDATESVTPIFKLSEDITSKITGNFQDFFTALNDYAVEIPEIPTQAEISRRTGGESTDGEQEAPVSREYYENEAVSDLLNRLDRTLAISRQLVNPVSPEDLRKLLSMEPETRAQLRDVMDRSIREQIISVFYESDLDRVLRALRESILSKAREANISTDNALLAANIAGYFIQPNAVVDEAATQAAKRVARENTPVVTGTVRENEIVMRKGDVVNLRHLDILDALGLLSERRETNVLPMILLFALIMGAGFGMNITHAVTVKGSHLKDFRYYLLLYLVFTIAYLSSFLFIRLTLSPEIGRGDTGVILASLPIIGAAVLFSHYIGRIAALIMSTLLAVLITLA
ncbi:MAG TPA: hypothetical protein ENN67_06130, partial [Firmicutes bacterium]|nr:hypothetical protein [Bacillota bacterium]